MHGFVREELPLVCQKCNPAVTCRDPALRGKLLRQKCVSVGAPSCLASLSLFLCILLTTYTFTLSFPLYSTSIYISLSIYPLLSASFLFTGLPSPSFFPFIFPSVTVNSMRASISISTSKTPHPHRASHSPWKFLACEGVEVLLSGDRSLFLLQQRK